MLNISLSETRNFLTLTIYLHNRCIDEKHSLLFYNLYYSPTSDGILMNFMALPPRKEATPRLRRAKTDPPGKTGSPTRDQQVPYSRPSSKRRDAAVLAGAIGGHKNPGLESAISFFSSLVSAMIQVKV